MKRLEWPTICLLVAAASLAVGPRFVLPVVVPGQQHTWWEPLQHLCLLMALFFNALRYGRHAGLVPWPAIVASLFLVASPALMATAPVELGSRMRAGHVLAAWGVLVLPWLAVVPRHQPATATASTYLLVSLSLCSAACGLVLHLFTDWQAFQFWNGTLYRFAGATRADYFAGLAYGGVVIAVHEWCRRGGRVFASLGTLNAILLIFSGSRTAILALGIWLVAYAILSPALRAKVSIVRARLWVALAAVSLAFLLHFPVLRDRMAGPRPGTINMSGREQIWAALFDHFQARPWLGLGIGSAQPGVLHPLLPHNELLRLLLELGVIGSVLYLAGVLRWIRRVRGMLHPEDRPYLLSLMLALPVYGLTDNPISACYITPFLYLGTLLPGPARLRDGEPGGREDG